LRDSGRRRLQASSWRVPPEDETVSACPRRPSRRKPQHSLCGTKQLHCGFTVGIFRPRSVHDPKMSAFVRFCPPGGGKWGSQPKPAGFHCRSLGSVYLPRGGRCHAQKSAPMLGFVRFYTVERHVALSPEQLLFVDAPLEGNTVA